MRVVFEPTDFHRMASGFCAGVILNKDCAAQMGYAPQQINAWSKGRLFSSAESESSYSHHDKVKEAND